MNINQINSKRKSIKKSNTPPKRKSILTLTAFGSDDALKQSMLPISSSTKQNYKKFNLEIDLSSVKVAPIQEENNLIVNEENINQIFDNDYEEKIESNLLKVWESAEKQMENDLNQIEEEMSIFLDNLADEKFTRSMEINEKYENELKDLLNDLDLDDENNVNTIIYNELKHDREKEIKEYYKELDERKKKGLKELRLKSSQLKNNFDKKKEIERVKSDIAQGIRSKIIKSLTPKETMGKRIDFSSINLDVANKNKKKSEFGIYRPPLIVDETNCESDRASSEESDDVKVDSIQLNKNLRKSMDNNKNKNKDINSKLKTYDKRISRGFIGTVFTSDKKNTSSNPYI